MEQHMSFDLTGRKALVTGASRGIGRAVAEKYAAAGADVAVLARDESLLREVAQVVESYGRKAVVVTADVTDADSVHKQVASAIEQLGGLDILVNNAGGNSFSVPVATMRFSGWEKTFRLNLDSVVHVTQAASEALIASGNASVINMSSVAGVSAMPTMAHYGAAKAGLISLTKSLAIEWAATGARVNALVPGWIETDLTEFLRADSGIDAGAALIDRVPMHRWGTANEIAEPALFLASSASSFMTGQVLVVDGGLTVMP
jgi:2-deoxy-D-gluconate 3-dehydrogenase